MSTTHEQQQQQGNLLLHAALEAKQLDLDLIRHLATQYGANGKNSRGSTPLMIAANGKGSKRHNKALVDILLQHGKAAQSLQETDKKGRTATMIAQQRPCPPLAKRLQILEQTTTIPQEKTCTRCATCRRKLRKGQSKLETLRDRVQRGQETNRLVQQFYDNNNFVQQLARPEFHRVNSCVNFRKELTESMAMVNAIQSLGYNNDKTTKNNWNNWQLIDLCCGSSLTTALCLYMLPGVVVTPCDILEEHINMPHYQQAGWTPDRIAYLQHDITATDFVARLQERLLPNHSYIVLGVHCCGELSLKALDIYEVIQARAALLIPCCFPSKASGIVPQVYNGTNIDKVMYERWVQHLQSLARNKPCVETTCVTRVEDVLSNRNLLLTIQSRDQ